MKPYFDGTGNGQITNLPSLPEGEFRGEMTKGECDEKVVCNTRFLVSINFASDAGSGHVSAWRPEIIGMVRRIWLQWDDEHVHRKDGDSVSARIPGDYDRILRESRPDRRVSDQGRGVWRVLHYGGGHRHGSLAERLFHELVRQASRRGVRVPPAGNRHCAGID